MYNNRPRPRADDWKYQDRSKMTRAQKVIVDRKILNRSAAEYEYPKFHGKVPVNLEWSQHKTLFPLAMIPIVARWLFMRLTGWTVHPVILYMLTVVFNSHFTRQHFYRLRRYVETHGFLDGEVERDAIPESMTGKIYNEMLNGLLGRPLMVIFLSYDRTKLPTLSWWLPLQLAVFTIIADFVYYWAHRATHEIPWLWKFHRLHHTTKHPSSYLLAFADEPQEFFDALGTPILTYMAYPIGFDAFYIWTLYFNSIEIMGHSGVRAYYPGVLTSILLRPFGTEIVVEDHDLHHRFGWRDSHNYGKQSMLWDTLFGTASDRFETHAENIDWDSRLQ
ncbi:hypothetical protein MYAM1_002768 [Malassezia yamatoensis]|uniref:Fatty acid hydroxylase domain-containing protein n=1 Tax=Malassezia yamatoensis TaxID=253288 RepID=A0AAJ5YUJ7_9BASI|nr:hypothetical protein MYAM1_002768 [Malassezia yamatoensis]